MDLDLRSGEILVLRTCDPDGTSYGGGFQWTLEVGAVVEAPDWEPTDQCGHGLHGLPWGVGGDCLGKYNDPHLLVAIDPSKDYVHGTGDMTNKCKFRQCRVVFIGSREEAVKLLHRYAPSGSKINYSTQTAGNVSTQTAGNVSTQTAGNVSTQTAGGHSTQTAGDFSTQTAGGHSTQTAGDFSTQTAGNKSTQTAGNVSTQTAGNKSTQTAGGHSTQTAGDFSTQTAGSHSTQTAGDFSTQIAGNKSTQTAGKGSVQICRWWENGCYRIATRVVGEEDASKPYKVVCGVWKLVEAIEA